jgi:hypothetical protein
MTRERNAVVQQAALFAGTADLSAFKLSETDIQQAVIGGIWIFALSGKKLGA